MAGSPPNLHTMVPSPACIQGVLKVKVEVKGHVTWGVLWCHETRSFLQADSWTAGAPPNHDGSQPCLHPGCAQRQGLCQRSRYTGTLLKDVLKVKVEIKGYVTGAFLWFHKNRFFSPGKWLDYDETQLLCDTLNEDVFRHALTLWSTTTLSFQYKYQAARSNV